MAKPLRYPHKRLVAFDDKTISAIEAWRKTQSPIPSEPEAVRRLVNKALETELNKASPKRKA